MMKFTIAIDGPAGAGKSTIAKTLAQDLQVVYVDTGAMYRTVAYGCFIQGIELENESLVVSALDEMKISLDYKDGQQHVYLDGIDVSEAIRTPEMGMQASIISAYQKVRETLVKLQQNMAASINVVMDGRDIGTHVLPNATLKVYLTASVEERAQRRLQDFANKGQVASYEEVKAEIEQRDFQDMNREHAPLVQAEDAIVIDTSFMTIPEVVSQIKGLLSIKRN